VAKTTAIDRSASAGEIRRNPIKGAKRTSTDSQSMTGSLPVISSERFESKLRLAGDTDAAG